MVKSVEQIKTENYREITTKKKIKGVITFYLYGISAKQTNNLKKSTLISMEHYKTTNQWDSTVKYEKNKQY